MQDLHAARRRRCRSLRPAHRIIPERRRLPRARAHLASAREPMPALRRARASRGRTCRCCRGSRCAEDARRARRPISVRYPIVEALTGCCVRAGDVVGAASRRRSRQFERSSASDGAGRLGTRHSSRTCTSRRSASCSLSSTSTRTGCRTASCCRATSSAASCSRSAALLSGDWTALLRAGIGMVALYAFYFVLRLVRPGGMGGGDVKLAGVVGMYLGYLGWGALAVGAFAAFLLGGVFGIALLILRRAGRKSRDPVRPVDAARRVGGSVRRRGSRPLVRESVQRVGIGRGHTHGEDDRRSGGDRGERPRG